MLPTPFGGPRLTCVARSILDDDFLGLLAISDAAVLSTRCVTVQEIPSCLPGEIMRLVVISKDCSMSGRTLGYPGRSRD